MTPYVTANRSAPNPAASLKAVTPNPYLQTQTDDGQDSAGVRDCLYDLTWSGAIGDGYTFDANGDVASLSNVVIEILPADQRNDDNQGHRILGPAPAP